MRILENLTGITILLAWAGAVGMALLVAIVMALVWRDHTEPSDELRVYGRPAELRPVLMSCLLAVFVMSLWPPTAFALGGALVELTLATQRRSRPGAPPVELPTEGVALLAGWRLLGWTAIGLLPSALPEVLVGRDGIEGLSGLVWVGLALGVWAAMRGAPTPFPLLAELAWVSLKASDEPKVVAPSVRPPTARARANQEHIEALAAEAAAPRVVAEQADHAADAREAAAQLARAAIAAQLAAMGLSAASHDDEGEPTEPTGEPPSDDDGDAAIAGLDEEEQPEIVVVKGRRRADAAEPGASDPSATEATRPSLAPSAPDEPPSPGAVAPPASSATEPAATEPAATEPAATEPAATEPAATEPAATEPAATSAASSVSDDLSGAGEAPGSSAPEVTAQPSPIAAPEPRAAASSSDPAEAPERPGSLAQAELEETSEDDLPG